MMDEGTVPPVLTATDHDARRCARAKLSRAGDAP